MDWLSMDLVKIDKERKQVCELFFKIMKVGRGKTTDKD